MSEPTNTPAAPSPVAKPAAPAASKENKVLKTTWQCGEFRDPDSGLTITPHGVLNEEGEVYSPNAEEVKALKDKARASRIRLVEEGDDN